MEKEKKKVKCIFSRRTGSHKKKGQSGLFFLHKKKVLLKSTIKKGQSIILRGYGEKQGVHKFYVFSGFFQNVHHSEGDKNSVKMGTFLHLKNQEALYKLPQVSDSKIRSCRRQAKNTWQFRL